MIGINTMKCLQMKIKEDIENTTYNFYGKFISYAILTHGEGSELGTSVSSMGNLSSILPCLPKKEFKTLNVLFVTTMKNTYCLFQVKFITGYTNVQHIIITQI